MSLTLNKNEISGLAINDSYLKSYYTFDLYSDPTLDYTGRYNYLAPTSDPASVTGVFNNGVEFDGNDLYAMGASNATNYYKFEGNANATFGGVNGTSSNVTYSTSYGKYNQGGHFNRSSSKIKLNTSALNVTTNDFTISFSFRSSQADSTYQAIVGKGGAGGEGWFVLLRNGTLRLNMDDGTNVNYAIPFGTVANGNWHNVCLIVDRDVGIFSYMDGAYYGFVDCRGTPNSLTNSLNSTIGVWSNETQWWFDGDIDNVCFFNSALPSYMGYQMTSSEYFSDWTPVGNFSVSSWVKTTTTNANYYLQAYSDSTYRAGWLIGTTADGKVQFYSGKNTGTTNGTDYKYLDSNTAINDGEWHHVVGVYDGSYLRIYIDGREDNSVAWSYAPAYAATTYRRMGCYCGSGTNGSFFTGSLDDVAIWHKALTLAEIQTMCSRTYSIDTSENLSLSENIAITKSFLRNIVENISISEVFSKIFNKNKNFSETVSTSESFVKSTSFVRTFAENLSITDISVRIKSFVRAFQESAVISDTFVYIFVYYISITQNISITDSFSKVASYFRLFNEDLSVSDNIEKLLQSIRSFNENVAVTDEIKKNTEISVVENLSIAEILSIGALYTRDLLETLSITETIGKIKSMFKTFLEVNTSEEFFTKHIAKTYAESISLEDKITRKLNGVLLIWTFLKNKAATTLNRIVNKSPVTLTRIANKTTTITPQANKTPITYTKVRNKDNSDIWEQVPNRDE
jgi:hypothetical protein